MPIFINSDWDSRAVSSISKKMPPEKARKWELQAGHMFFKHRRATFHCCAIQQSYSDMIEEMPKYITAEHIEEGVHSSYAGSNTLADKMLFHLDGFFESERACFDFILKSLRTADLLLKDTGSFNNHYKKKIKNPYLVLFESSELDDALMTFWNDIGIQARDYRDWFTHFCTLSGSTWHHPVNMKYSKGEWIAKFYIHDNPKITSYSSLTFASNKDALVLCTKINQETDKFLKLIIGHCINKWGANMDSSLLAEITISNVCIGD